jgi:AcrR family transcriptional regulator
VATARGQRTRARLLEAAETVFGTYGYHETSLVQITEEAGVGLGTFYGHFRSKREIYDELIRTRGAELRAAVRDATVGLTQRRELEIAGFTAFFAWIAAHPGIYSVARQEASTDPQATREWYGAFAGDYASALARAMRESGVATGDPEVLAWAMMGMADFVAMRFIVWKGDGDLPATTLGEFLEVALRALGLAS